MFYIGTRLLYDCYFIHKLPILSIAEELLTIETYFEIELLNYLSICIDPSKHKYIFYFK